MDSIDLIIIGGDAAGMSAASQARRMDPEMSIAVFDRGSYVSYAACGMPYFISGEVGSQEDLIAINVEEFIREKKIMIHTGAGVSSADLDKKIITVIRNGSNEKYEYKKLIIATGAIPFIPEIEGIDGERIFFLRNLGQAIEIKKFINKKKPAVSAIIGGGFIGLEMAESFAKLGIKTAIIEKMPSVAMTMSENIRKMIGDRLASNNIEVITGATLKKISGPGNRPGLITDRGGFHADMVICAIGVVPNTGFLKDSGLNFDEKGAIIIDEKSRTGVKDVFAAGDCATVKNIITGKNVYMPLGTTANKQGRVAGLQAAGVKDESFRGIVGSQMVKVFELEIGKTGLNVTDAEREGIDARMISSSGKSRAGYYPGNMDVLVNITYDLKTERILGVEVAGTDNAALRLHAAVAAVTVGMTLRDFAYLDLGYAPPFSPVWDPVLTAAQKAVKRTV
ncbi:MAG: FAD-dependent oxidoreductase [Spirochaetes bacterium]|nr:FAD-dependent oxidoreductase [Spirochaetota bacterium]